MQPLPPGRPLIDYPCEWEYRVIGTDADEIRSAVASIIGDRRHSLRDGNRRGRFLSLVLELVVETEAQRDGIYRQLCQHAAVRIVL